MLSSNLKKRGSVMIQTESCDSLVWSLHLSFIHDVFFIADINNLFNKHCTNYRGKVCLETSFESTIFWLHICIKCMLYHFCVQQCFHNSFHCFFSIVLLITSKGFYYLSSFKLDSKFFAISSWSKVVLDQLQIL